MCGTSQVSPSPPVYLLTCSVCHEQFSVRIDWLKHLTEDNHQQLARLECLEKWDSELRKSFVILYSSIDLTSVTAEEIVKYFSSRFNDTVVLVTDFVWWEDRPRFGILQFESRGKVKEVLKQMGSNGSSKFLIGSNLNVQVRAGWKLMELEWDAILPSRTLPNPARLTSNKRSQLADPETNQTPTFSDQIMEPEMEEQEQHMPPPSKRVKLDESLDNTVIKSRKIPSIGAPINFLRSDQPLPPSMTSASHPLQFEYWTIRKAILIPDHQYNQAMETVSLLKTVLTKLIPNLKVHLFRNWYLKLKFPEDQPELLLFVYNPGKISADLCDKLRKFLSSKSSSRHLSLLVENPTDYGNEGGILKIKYLATNLNLSLVTPKLSGSLMEFQTCRLMEYLCQFDPRCHALITLACYWVTINSIDLIGETSQNPGNPLELPPHYTIQWLVIFFLIQGNYIPSPRQIQSKSFAKDILLTDDGTNIGFSWNSNYIQLWRRDKVNAKGRRDYCVSVDENSEEFLSSLLKLFHKFIHYCRCTLGNPAINWSLNIVNGLLINMKDLYETDPTTGKQRKKDYLLKKGLKENEMSELRNGVEREIRVKGKCEIFMTHPFLMSQKMAISDNIKFKFMTISKSDSKMEMFLKEITDHGVPAALAKWKSLKDVLK